MAKMETGDDVTTTCYQTKYTHTQIFEIRYEKPISRQ